LNFTLLSPNSDPRLSKHCSMASLSVLLLLGLSTLTSAITLKVTPIEKVITLIEDLKKQVETEGATEATNYDTFACFCKKTSMDKSKAILDGKDKINSLSASIEESTAMKENTEEELGDRKAADFDNAAKLEETINRCAKEKAEYDAKAADLSKAISSLESAIKALEVAKGAPGPTTKLSEPGMAGIQKTVGESLELASALNLLDEAHRGAITAFLQVDPSDPEYKYHSQGIIDTLNKLLEEFRAEKSSVDAEWAKTDKNCKDTIAAIKAEMGENGIAMARCMKEIADLKIKIASDRQSLIDSEALLKDDELYLNDLTPMCEARAHDWDQRTQLRAGELTALTQALEILKVDVKGRDTDVNKRALLSVNSRAVKQTSESTPAAAKQNPLSFLQRLSTSTSMESKKQTVVSWLRTEGSRLHSSALVSLASQASGNPFAKVEKLIQALIERLIAESTNEATKKGFCDTELGKATQDRDFRREEVTHLNVEIAGLESKQKELEAEIELLTSGLKKLRDALAKATEERAKEKADNIQTLKTAKEGLAAVIVAQKILKDFYKQAAKAKVFVQASPVDEDTQGPGFTGAYKGQQEASGGIIGLLEVIQTDFERTIRVTENYEKTAAAEFILFDRESKSDISGKETKKALDEEDLKTTKSTIAQKMEDMKAAQQLLDTALKTLEDLRPACVDSGMSYAERVAKRDAEITALKKALCILDPEGVERDCGLVLVIEPPPIMGGPDVLPPLTEPSLKVMKAPPPIDGGMNVLPPLTEPSLNR